MKGAEQNGISRIMLFLVLSMTPPLSTTLWLRAY